MRRLVLLVAVAALMVAMMVSASPAMAQDSFGNESDFDNSFDVVQSDGDFYVYDDGGNDMAELDDCYAWDGAYLCEVDF